MKSSSFFRNVDVNKITRWYNAEDYSRNFHPRMNLNSTNIPLFEELHRFPPDPHRS
jgi:hypothetical protein